MMEESQSPGQAVQQQDSSSSADESDVSSNTVFSCTSESVLIDNKPEELLMDVKSPDFLGNFLNVLLFNPDPSQKESVNAAAEFIQSKINEFWKG